ncbi:MAG: LexA family protein [Aliihoeflea sp.]|uniref:LexA family protein n=1 Tax=Aliihoeflea sp. TaxID=2608088 RepID=UPI00403356FE
MCRVVLITDPLEDLPALPCYTAVVACGFPSPAAEYEEVPLDLSEHLVRRPAATFYVRFAGSSMVGAGIHEGDLGVVDRSMRPGNGDVVVAILDGDLVCKRLVCRGPQILLQSDPPAGKPIVLTEEAELTIWGVVVHVIHSLRQAG